MNAILKEDPPEFAEINRQHPPSRSIESCAAASRRSRRSGSTRLTTWESRSRRCGRVEPQLDVAWPFRWLPPTRRPETLGRRRRWPRSRSCRRVFVGRGLSTAPANAALSFSASRTRRGPILSARESHPMATTIVYPRPGTATAPIVFDAGREPRVIAAALSGRRHRLDLVEGRARDRAARKNLQVYAPSRDAVARVPVRRRFSRRSSRTSRTRTGSRTRRTWW